MSGSQIPFTIAVGQTFEPNQGAVIDTGTLTAGVLTVGTASTPQAQTIVANVNFGFAHVPVSEPLDVTSIVVNSVTSGGPVTTQGDYFGYGTPTDADNLGGVAIGATTVLGLTVNSNNPMLIAAGITSFAGDAFYVGKDQAGDALFELVAVVPPNPTADVGNNGTLVLDFVLSAATVGSLGGDQFTTTGGAPLCFAAGTRILTPQGEQPVETLADGAGVVTQGGAVRPVRWIGRRRIDLARHPDPGLARPVRLAPDALAPGVPARALTVSPDHALVIPPEVAGEVAGAGPGGAVLVMARQLVNGASITQPAATGAVTYFHLELDCPDIVQAEGAWSESYVDTGNRSLFDNAPATALHPDLSPARRLATPAGARWLTTDPAAVAAIWRRLAARAGVADAAGGSGWHDPAGGLDPDGPLAADLHGVALLAGRRVVRPVLVQGERLTFALPRHAGRVRLLSPTARPCDARPWLDDRRLLGLPVRRVAVDGETLTLDGRSFGAGWWPPERGRAAFRWSSAGALLHLPPDAALLTIWVHGGAGSAAAARAA